MSIKPTGVIIDSNLYVQTERDIIYNNMVNYLFSTEILEQLLEEITNKEEFGENTNPLYSKLNFINNIVQYILLLKIELLQAGEDEDKIEEITNSYKLACFRKIALCEYHIEEIFDGLLEAPTVVLPDGIDYMILEGYFNNPPFLIP